MADTQAFPADPAHGDRVPNFKPAFIQALAERIGLRFDALPNPAPDVFGPEAVFHYLYAVLHAPSYRTRYAEFLKIDFPRLPLPVDAESFRALAALGARLVDLHLLRGDLPVQGITYPVGGDHRVAKGYPRFAEGNRVYLNATQYFEGVPPAVWAFEVGGYQVCEKWLKDRIGRVLTYDDQKHYKRIVAALSATLDVMERLDDLAESLWA